MCLLLLFSTLSTLAMNIPRYSKISKILSLSPRILTLSSLSLSKPQNRHPAAGCGYPGAATSRPTCAHSSSRPPLGRQVYDEAHVRPNLAVSIPLACRTGLLDPDRENMVRGDEGGRGGRGRCLWGIREKMVGAFETWEERLRRGRGKEKQA